MEFFIAWYSAAILMKRWVFGHRLFGHHYWYGGWILIVINVGAAATALDQKSPAKPAAHFRHRHADQHRHVV